ncbi:MAG: ABC transporter permease, partial [Lachnospiraceae bacterium]|nr:ABC transporter permease [Lachnospiraceae bacterium]
IYHALETKKSWFLMTAAFALTIILIFSFNVLMDFARLLLPSLNATSADIALSSYANEMNIDRSLVDEIRKIDDVVNVYGSSYMANVSATSSRAGIDHINIVSYDDTLLDYSKGNIAQGTLDAVYGDSSKVATVFNRNNSLKVGDTIQFAGEEVEITCALSQGLFGDDLIVICSQETFDRMMGNTEYGLIGIQLAPNASEETVAQIRNFENDDMIITDLRESNRQDAATYWATQIASYGFLSLIWIISLFNIINSISMSVSARIKQYGAMRAVGMESRQLRRMISAEAYTYAVSGFVVGCSIGLPLSRFLHISLITRLMGIEWHFPLLWFGIVFVFLFVSAVAAVTAPANRIRKMAITATINEL